jgi:phospholipid-transporting ATPase
LLLVFAGPPTPAEIRYEAESPDEAALVVAAKVFGFFMIKRTNTTITLRERMPDGSADLEYDVLNLLEFNSTRKRMSVIVKDRQTGRMVLYCKVGRDRACPATRGVATVPPIHR